MLLEKSYVEEQDKALSISFFFKFISQFKAPKVPKTVIS